MNLTFITCFDFVGLRRPLSSLQSPDFELTENCRAFLLKRTEGEKEVAKLRDSTSLAERWG